MFNSYSVLAKIKQSKFLLKYRNSINYLKFLIKPFKLKFKGTIFAILIFLSSSLLFYLDQLLIHHFNIILAYLSLSCIISIVYIYYHGPIESQKTFRLIEYTLKALSLIAFYNGISFKEVGLVMLIAIIFGKNFLINFVNFIIKIRYI